MQRKIMDSNLTKCSLQIHMKNSRMKLETFQINQEKKEPGLPKLHAF